MSEQLDLRGRAIQSLRAHLPELVDRELRELGHGLDNTVFLVDGLVLRMGNVRSVAQESRLLEIVAEHVSIPVPSPCFADVANGVLGYAVLPGRSLLGRTPPPGAAEKLGRFLRELHSIDPSTVSDVIAREDPDPREWLADLDAPSELIHIVQESVPPPTDRYVVAHADLGAENILEQDGSLTGIVDWSDAAITDPALDFARLYRDFGLAFLGEAVEAYGGLDDAFDRIEYFARCAALEDLNYGRTTGRREYTQAAERAISWLFSQ